MQNQTAKNDEQKAVKVVTSWEKTFNKNIFQTIQV